MDVLQVLPVGDLASRKRFKKTVPITELVVMKEWKDTEEAVRRLFEDFEGKTDLTVFLTSEEEGAHLPLLEDLLHHYKLRYPKRLQRVRLALSSPSLCLLLEANVRLDSFSEVAVGLEADVQRLLEVLGEASLEVPLVLLVDATHLVVSVGELLERVRRFGFQRVEVFFMAPEHLQAFSYECIPLYKLPGDAGMVGLWKDCAVVVPRAP